MPRFYPLMPEANADIPRMVVIDPSYINEIAAWVVAHAGASFIPNENENVMAADAWKLVWRRFSVHFEGKGGTLLMGRFHGISPAGRDSLVAGMIRTDIPELLKAIDDLLWNDIESAPRNGTVVWLRNELMESPCLGSFGEYQPTMTKTVFMRWTVDRDFTPGMPAPVGSLVKPTQWRSGLGKIERDMPNIVNQSFVGLPINKPDGDILTGA